MFTIGRELTLLLHPVVHEVCQSREGTARCHAGEFSHFYSACDTDVLLSASQRLAHRHRMVRAMDFDAPQIPKFMLLNVKLWIIVRKKTSIMFFFFLERGGGGTRPP